MCIQSLNTVIDWCYCWGKSQTAKAQKLGFTVLIAMSSIFGSACSADPGKSLLGLIAITMYSNTSMSGTVSVPWKAFLLDESSPYRDGFIWKMTFGSPESAPLQTRAPIKEGSPYQGLTVLLISRLVEGVSLELPLQYHRMWRRWLTCSNCSTYENWLDDLLWPSFAFGLLYLFGIIPILQSWQPSAADCGPCKTEYGALNCSKFRVICIS